MSFFSCLSASATPRESTTFDAMSDCTWNTSVSAASNGCCHFVAGASLSLISTSSGLTWTRLVVPDFCQRTVAVSRYRALSSLAISCGVLVVFL